MGNHESYEKVNKSHSHERHSQAPSKSYVKAMRRRSTTVVSVNRVNANLSVIQNEIDKLERKRKPMLSQTQKITLVKSWNHHSYRHSHSSENIAVKIYLKLFDVCPETKIIFGFEKMETSQLMFDKKFIRQTKLFINVIEDALKNLDNLDDIVRPNLYALGGRHVKMRELGFKVQHLDVFAESMLECIIEAQGIHRHRDTTAAWRIFISWMTGIMKDGYYYSLKMQRRSTIPIEANMEKLKIGTTTTNYESFRQASNLLLSPNENGMKKMNPVQNPFILRQTVRSAIISRV